MTTAIKSLGVLLAATLLAAGGYPWIAPREPAPPRSEKAAVRPPPEMEHGPRHLRQIALTFDAGAGMEGLPDLLRVLEREGVVATFFLTGRWASENPAYAAMIAERGHVIGNHSWSHKDLTKLNDGEVRQEVLRVDDRFVSWFGPRYHPLFRAPFGETNDRVLAVIEELGFRTVRWSIDTLDAMEPRKTASFLEGRVLKHSDEELCGAIVLLHVGYPETCDALPVIIHNLRERGFDFVPVSAWLPKPMPALTGIRAAQTSDMAAGILHPQHLNAKIPCSLATGGPASRETNPSTTPK